MMKQTLLALLLLLVSATAATAQSNIKFGYANCDSLLRTLPEYADVQSQMEQLRNQYKTETEYNEQTFKRQFAEFLQGQKNFTENILQKRQRDLQQSLRESLRFRHQADSLLQEAEREMLRPVRARLQQALTAVGLEHGYEYILDTSRGAYPFIHPSVGEDCTAYLREKLGNH